MDTLTPNLIILHLRKPRNSLLITIHKSKFYYKNNMSTSYIKKTRYSYSKHRSHPLKPSTALTNLLQKTAQLVTKNNTKRHKLNSITNAIYHYTITIYRIIIVVRIVVCLIVYYCIYNWISLSFKVRMP